MSEGSRPNVEIQRDDGYTLSAMREIMRARTYAERRYERRLIVTRSPKGHGVGVSTRSAMSLMVRNISRGRRA